MNRSRSSIALRTVPVFLGLAGIVGSFLLGAFNGAFHWWHLAGTLLGIGTLVGGLAWLNDARWRDTLATWAYSFFAICCAVPLYLIAANRTTVYDLTRDRLFTLSPQTQSLLRGLPREDRFRIVHAIPQNEQPEMAEFYALYRASLPTVEVEMLDPVIDLAALQQFGERLDPNDLLLYRIGADGSTKKVRATLRPGQPTREQVLSNAIAEVALSRESRVYFTVGHGERPLAAKQDDRAFPESLTRLVTVLAQTGFPAAPLRLLDGVPEDAAAVVLAGPAIDLFDYERDALLAFLAEGGNAIVLLDPQLREEGAMPNLLRVLEAGGLAAPNEFIVDPVSAQGTNSMFTPGAEPYGEHAIAKALPRGALRTNATRPIDALNPAPAGVEVRPLLVTNANSWTMTPKELRANPRPDAPPAGKQSGVLPVAGVSSSPTNAGRRGAAAKLVAVGDSDAFTNAQLTNESALFIVQTLNWMAERRTLLQVPPTLIRATPANVTARSQWTMLAAFCAIGAGIGIGGTVLSVARRRRR